MNYKCKILLKKAMALLLSSSMALGSVFTTGVMNTVTSHAASYSKLSSVVNWNLDDEVKSEVGRADEAYITATQIWSIAKKQMDKGDLQIEYSPSLKKITSSASGHDKVIYTWANNYDSDIIKGGEIYGADLSTDGVYWMKFAGIELPGGKKITVKFSVSKAIKNNPNGDNYGESGNTGGPYIVFYPKNPGECRWTGFKRVRCDMEIYDYGNAETLSSDVYADIAIMDIDQNQAVMFSEGSTKMIVDSSASTIGNKLTVGTNVSSGYKNHLKSFSDIDDSKLKYILVDEDFHNADHSSAHNDYSVATRLHFTKSRNQFTYWFFSGRNDDSLNYGEQTAGIVMWFAQEDNSGDEQQDPPKAPVVSKQVNGVTDYTMKSGGEAVNFTLQSAIHETVAEAVKSDTFALNSFGWTDTLESVLAYNGEWKVTLDGKDVSSLFTNTSSGQNINVMMKSPKTNIAGGNYVLTFGAKIKEGSDLSSYLTSDGYAKIPNKGSVLFDANGLAAADKKTDSNVVTIKWKPAERPAPVKEVSKTSLDHADESFNYYVTQEIPADTWAFGYMDKFEFTDQVDQCLKFNASDVKIGTAKDKNDLADQFTISVNGNMITATAKNLQNDTFYGKGIKKAVVLTISNVHYYLRSDEGSYDSHRLKDIKGHTPAMTGQSENEKYTHVNAEEKAVLMKNKAAVETAWDKWGSNWNAKVGTDVVSTDVAIPKTKAPTKTVTDADESGVKANTLTDANEIWYYTIEQKIPEKMAAIYRYSSFKITDQIDPCLTIGKDVKSGSNKLSDITITIGDKTMAATDVKVEEKDNLLTITPSADLLKGGKDNLFYGGEGLKGQTIRITIPVHIYSGGDEGGSDASNEAVLMMLRKHGHMTSNDEKTEAYMTFDNKAATIADDMLVTTPESQETETVSTKLLIPQIKDPVKNVFDTDDLDWNRSTKDAMSEASVDPKAKDQTKNRLSDSTKEWYYTLDQEVPARSVELFYYKTFRFEDQVDSCLSYDVKDIKVYYGTKTAVKDGAVTGAEDVTSLFTLTKGEDNKLIVTAKDEALKAPEFYGTSKDGNHITVVFPVHLNDALGKSIFDNKTLQEHNGHLLALEDGTSVYDVKNADTKNPAKTMSDNLVIVKNNAENDTPKEDERLLNEVETQLETADPDCSKEADRFEWEVGESVKYTIKVKNKNPYSIMDRVTITDEDLPDCMQLDGSDKDAIIVYAKGATENHAAPNDKAVIPATRGMLTETEGGAITEKVTKDAIWAKASWDPSFTDEITKLCEVTYLNDKGDTGNGFTVMIPKQYRGEEISITFLCKITEDWSNCKYKANCANGSIVENEASVTAALMFPNEAVKDAERIWINTPHLTIQKVNGTWSYENGKFVPDEVDQHETNFKKGDQIHYSLLVQNAHPGTLARDILVRDKITSNGLSFKGNLTVHKLYLNAKGETKEVPLTVNNEDVQFSTDHKEFSVRLNRNLRFDGDMPFAASVKENVHNRGYELGSEKDTKVPGIKRMYPEDVEGDSVWKSVPDPYEAANEKGLVTADSWESFRTVVSHPQEWKDADIAYIVEYDAEITEGISATEILKNTAYVDAENAEEASDSHQITGGFPVINIEKTSDKEEYEVGETGHYLLKVRNTEKETIAKNVVIKDALYNKDAVIDRDSIHVIYYKDAKDYKYDAKEWKTEGGVDITDKCTIPEEANSDTDIYVNTASYGKDLLTTKAMFVVTYDVKFEKVSLAGTYVPNTAATKADNACAELKESTAFGETVTGLYARKMSDPYNGSVVTKGSQIVYTIELSNRTSKDMEQVLVKDYIPEKTTYVEGSAKMLGPDKAENGGTAKALALKDGNAVIAMIPTLHAYETKYLTFAVTVNEDVKDEDVVVNTAWAFVPEKDTKVTDALYDSAEFKPTNMTEHPLANWATDDNLVHVIGKDITLDKTSDKKTYYVGETIHYSITLANHGKIQDVKDLVLDDTVEENETIKIKEDSFKILWNKKDITNDLKNAIQVNETKDGFHIDFGRDLKPGEEVKVLYDATALRKADKVTNNGIFNESDELKVFTDVKIEEPALILTKDVDSETVMIGEEAVYTVRVSMPTDRSEVKNLVIEDNLEEKGLILIKEDSIKVAWNDKDISSDCVITVNPDKDGYRIETGKTLTTKDAVKVTYRGVPTDAGLSYCKNEETDGFIDNTAAASGDDTEKVTDTAKVKIMDADNGLHVEKASDKKIYSVTTDEMMKNNTADTAHYTVKVTNTKDGVARNVAITDAFELLGMKIDKDSIHVFKFDAKTQKEAEITERILADRQDAINLNETENGYLIKTGENLGLSDYIRVTYDVIFTDAALADKEIKNIVVATDDNGDEVSADNTVSVKIPALTPEKESDKEAYSVGETGHYTIKVTQDEKDITALNVVVEDKLSGKGDFAIVNDSVKVFDKDGKDITKEMKELNVEKDSLVIKTGKNLAYKEFLTVTYDVSFKDPALSGTAVANVVHTKADNAPEVSADQQIIFDGLAVLKSSEPVSGTEVKTPVYGEDGKLVMTEDGSMTFENDEIIYHITLKNETDADKENVLVRDRIPEGSSFLSSEDGELVKVDGKDYAAFVIEKIEAGKEVTVSFKVKVTADGFALIKNTAEVKTADSMENPSFDGDGWKKTNEVVHPVPNIVRIKDAPVLHIEKTSDKAVYEVGDTGHYTVVVNNTKEDTIAENVVIKDTILTEGASIVKGSIHIADSKGRDFTTALMAEDPENGIVAEETSYIITTGRNLASSESFTVTYDVSFAKETLANKTVINVAKAKADNAMAETDHEVPVPVEIGEGLTMVKSSDPVSGTRVEAGQKIHYDITVTAEKDQDNVLILDEIPEHTTYVEDSAKIEKAENAKDQSLLEKVKDMVKDLTGGDKEEQQEMSAGAAKAVIKDKTHVAYTIPHMNAGETYVASFDVTVNDDVTEDDTIVNVALGKTAGDEDLTDPSTWNPDDFVPTNKVEHPLGPWVETEHKVDVIAPELSIEKKADKEVYHKDEKPHYTITVTNTAKDTTAKNLVIMDEITSKGTKIVADSIQVTNPEGKKVTGLVTEVTDTTLRIDTNDDLAFGEIYMVEYDVVFEEGVEAGSVITNVASAKADNAFVKTEEDITPVEVEEGLTAFKLSDPVSGTKVKAGDEITYTIEVSNKSDKEKKNIYVMDAIPEHTTYVANSGGQIKTVNGKDYVCFVIDSIKAMESQQVSFKVKVHEDVKESHVILNTALVSKSHEEPVKDPWNPDEFIPTNQTRHPLGNWVTDDEIIKVEEKDAIPELAITKVSDKAEYKIGETGKYTLTIKNLTEGTTAENIVIQDAFENQKVKILRDSIVVTDQDGKKVDITYSEDQKTAYGFKIATGVNLDGGKSMIVTYDAVFEEKSLAGSELVNTATADADNANPVTVKNTVKIKESDTPEKEKNQTEKKNENSKDGKDGGSNRVSGTVKTSDILILVLIASVIILAGSGTVYLIRKKKKQ